MPRGKSTKRFESHDDLHPLFMDLINDIADMDHEEKEALAFDADVSIATLYNWQRPDGTIAPRSSTLFRVAEALGYKVTWSRKAALKVVRKVA